MIDELKTYLSIAPNKFEIFLYDTKKFKNLYKQSVKLDTQLEGVNYVTLNKFLEDNIFKIEKLSGNFINNICVIIDNNQIKNINFSIKKKNYEKKINKIYIEKLLTDAKDIFRENYHKEKILHILLNSFVVDGSSFLSFQDDLVGDIVIIQVQFKSVSFKLLKDIDNVFEKFHIKVSDYLDQNYLKTLSRNQSFELDQIAYKVQNGFNEKEVNLVPKKPKKKGFFEKFFQLFN